MSQHNNNSSPNDFYTNLLNNHIPSPAHSSSANQASNSSPSQGSFAQFATNPNPFSQQQFIPQQQLPFNPQPFPFNPQQLPFNQQQFPYNQQPFPFNPQQQYFPQQQLPYFPQQPTPPIQPEVESVPETQPETEQQKTKRKGKKKVGETSERPKRQIRPWTPDEEKVLAERWRDASENPIIGNSQTADSFWTTVLVNYNRLVDRKRNIDQLTGKWAKLQKDIKTFITIYDRYKNEWRSGASDLDIMEAARSGFRDRTGHPFTHEAAWKVLYDCPKFNSPEGVMSNRRRQQPEPPISLEDDEPLRVDPNPNVAPLFADDPIRRPPGRGLSRKSQKSSGSSDAASSRCSSDDVRSEIIKAQQEIVLTQQEKRQSSIMKRMSRAFKVLNTAINPNLPTKEQKLLAYYRETLKATMPQPPPEEDEDEEHTDDN